MTRNLLSRLFRPRPAPPFTPSGHIDRILGGRVQGWVKARQGDAPVTVDLLIDGVLAVSGVHAGLFRRDLLQAGIGGGRHGFACDLPPDAPRDLAGRTILLRQTDTGEVLVRQLITTQMLAPPADPAPAPDTSGYPDIQAALDPITPHRLSGWALDRAAPDRRFQIQISLDGLPLTTIRNDLPGPPDSSGQPRPHGGFACPLLLDWLEPGDHALTATFPDGTHLTRSITAGGNAPPSHLAAPIPAAEAAVIVPVFNAYDDVTRCIARLQRYTPPEVEILLIDDASTDPRIAPLLAGSAADPRIRVLTNPRNLGFTRTVNRGLDAVGRKHPILLNSDARVTQGWAHGLLRAATSHPRIATVTPMSDRAGAFSAPRKGDQNDLPPGVDEITFARAFRARSLGLYPLVPTGNGFCMFINRACLDQIGGFDAAAFPRGYGEENDFAMRAGRAGWQHVIDDRSYVFHAGSKSFGDSKAALMQAGRETLAARYPDYGQAVRVFSHGSEIALARHRAALALRDCNDARAGRPRVLFHVKGCLPDRLAQTLEDAMEPWVLAVQAERIALHRWAGGQWVETHSELTEAGSPAQRDTTLQDWLEEILPDILHLLDPTAHCLPLQHFARERGVTVVLSLVDPTGPGAEQLARASDAVVSAAPVPWSLTVPVFTLPEPSAEVSSHNTTDPQQAHRLCLLASTWREVYRHLRGQSAPRPLIAVVTDAGPGAPTSPVAMRTVNADHRPCLFLHMTPRELVQALQDDLIDGVITDGAAAEALPMMQQRAIRYLMHVEDAPSPHPLIDTAATVTTASQAALSSLRTRTREATLLPDRLDDSAWRGTLPARERDGMVRALCMGGDLASIATAVSEVARHDPAFRVGVIAAGSNPLPDWAERLPPAAEAPGSLIPWLRRQAASFDLMLVPEDGRAGEACWAVLAGAAMGLPVLTAAGVADDMAADHMPGLRRVEQGPAAWADALALAIDDVRRGAFDRNAIRDDALSRLGLHQTLPEFDALLLALARPPGGLAVLASGAGITISG
ncbi:glycosyltransferase [Paracoccus jeotgali]|uniref:glycosyltransferase n=1 Tax=Paracoccus jeotgali TaxID=2065379 RepID=UPI0028A82653|nr:glycosyltransferase [Paracoccus jeotgali]